MQQDKEGWYTLVLSAANSYNQKRILESTEAMLADGDDTINLTCKTDIKIAEMKINTPIDDGILVFDSLPFLGVKHISEEYLPILNLLCEIINADYRVTGETYFLSCFSFSSPEGHFGISRYITEGATLIENISRDYPPAEAWRNPTDQHDMIYIPMHEEIVPGFDDRIAERIEAIYQAYDIENSNVESYYFILTDENDRGWCRIRVSKSGPRTLKLIILSRLF